MDGATLRRTNAAFEARQRTRSGSSAASLGKAAPPPDTVAKQPIDVLPPNPSQRVLRALSRIVAAMRTALPRLLGGRARA